MFGGDDVDKMLEAAERRTRPRKEEPRPPRGARGRSRSRSRERRPRRGISPSFSRDVGMMEDLRKNVDLERDEKTVFVCQIHPKCNEKDLFLFFSRVGRVADIQLMRDNRTLKSKGLAYVEFAAVASVWSALRLSGQLLGGYPVKVQPTQAEKNRAAQESARLAEEQRQAAAAAGLPSQPKEKAMKLYVTNIPQKLKEEDLLPMFGALGEVLSCEIKCDRRGRSRGYGYVEYRKEACAIDAIAKLNGMEVLGLRLKVVPADPSQGLAGMMSAAPKATGSMVSLPSGVQMPGSGGMDAVSAAAASFSQGGVFEDSKLQIQDGNGGIMMTSSDKLSLMQKLAHGGTMNVSAVASGTPAGGYRGGGEQTAAGGRGGDGMQATETAFGHMSECLLLKNMFDPRTESNPDFDKEIREDVSIEVSKFARLQHIFVDRTSRDGLVYVKLSSAKEAMVVAQALNGRSFGQTTIAAQFFPRDDYKRQFRV